MNIQVLTLFPEMFAAVSECGITARAMKRGLWELGLWNPRDVTTDLHRTVDDRPFGGGPGMVLMAEPLALTLERAQTDDSFTAREWDINGKKAVLAVRKNG